MLPLLHLLLSFNKLMNLETNVYVQILFFGNFQDTFCWRRTKNNKLKGDKNIKVWPLNSNQTFNQTIAALNANMTNAPAETTNTALNRRRQDAIRIAKNNHILLITILYCDLDNISTWFLLCFPTRTTCFFVSKKNNLFLLTNL